MGPFLSVLWAKTAEAEPDRLPLTITTSAGTFEVTNRELPAPARLDRADRTCVVDLQWAPGGNEVTTRGCPDVVSADVVGAVSRWVVAAPAGLGGVVDLGELWFVYPFEAEAPPRVLVRQSHDRLLSLPSDVDVLPFAISAWSFVRYPQAAHRDGVPDVSCTVQVRADLRGNATDVRVEGCGDPYREAARSAIANWRFEPPMVYGEAIPTGLTLRTTFVAEAPDGPEPFQPSEESQRLWAERQFEALPRSERIQFIEAALLGDPTRDLGPGHVRVALPGAPDLGGREPPTFWSESSGRGPIRPLPDHPPLLVIGKVDRVAVEVFELALPPPETVVVDEVRSCRVLVQVDGERRVFSWAEEDCDPAVRSLALTTADGWLLRHDGPAVQSNRARFQATLVFEPGGASRVVFVSDELRTPQTELPPGVHTHRDPKPLERTPPRLPKDLPLPDAVCTLAVTVTRDGRPKDVRVEACPTGFEASALQAVRKWRWRPAEDDGHPIESATEVSIRFNP